MRVDRWTVYHYKSPRNLTFLFIFNKRFPCLWLCRIYPWFPWWTFSFQRIWMFWESSCVEACRLYLIIIFTIFFVIIILSPTYKTYRLRIWIILWLIQLIFFFFRRSIQRFFKQINSNLRIIHFALMAYIYIVSYASFNLLKLGLLRHLSIIILLFYYNCI